MDQPSLVVGGGITAAGESGHDLALALKGFDNANGCKEVGEKVGGKVGEKREAQLLVWIVHLDVPLLLDPSLSIAE